MKTILTFLSFVLLSTQHCFNQWFWQNPSPQGNYLNSVYFTDSNTGWVVGWSGIILKTTDGGANRISQSSGKILPLSSVYFSDPQAVWSTGLYGKILAKTNGGSILVEEEKDETSTGYSLTQNFPNPFNPSTKIKYTVPQT